MRLFLMLFFFTTFCLVGCMSANYPKSDHYDGKTFYNPSGKAPKKFLDLLKWWREEAAEWPESVPLKPQQALVKNLANDEMHISFINHASFLIRTAEWSLITDPHFTERASPLSFAGPKRVHPPGVSLDAIDRLDYVFISHNHYDHLDLESLHLLQKRFPKLIFLVPLGNEKLLQSQGFKNILVADWWQKFDLLGLEFYLTPAEHWSARGLFDRNKSLWGGLLIKSNENSVLFAGDTGYGPHFKTLKDRFGKPDIALLPIGAYEPRWFMKNQHMNPEDAVLAHLDLKADLSVGMHFGCFQLTNESIDQPAIDLAVAMQKHLIHKQHFLVPEPGQTVILKD